MKYMMCFYEPSSSRMVAATAEILEMMSHFLLGIFSLFFFPFFCFFFFSAAFKSRFQMDGTGFFRSVVVATAVAMAPPT